MKLEDQKNILKNKILYGSYYQENNYIEQHKPSRAYRTYVKEVKSDFSRKPGTNEEVVK